LFFIIIIIIIIIKLIIGPQNGTFAIKCKQTNCRRRQLLNPPSPPPPSCFNEYLAIGEFDLWALVVLLGNLLMGHYNYLVANSFSFESQFFKLLIVPLILFHSN
jgi:hypothetical protein